MNTPTIFEVLLAVICSCPYLLCGLIFYYPLIQLALSSATLLSHALPSLGLPSLHNKGEIGALLKVHGLMVKSQPWSQTTFI